MKVQITADLTEEEIKTIANRVLSKKTHIALVEYHLEQLCYDYGFSLDVLEKFRFERKQNKIIF